MDSLQLLEKLVSFPTVSRDSNLDLIRFVAELLKERGIAPTIINMLGEGVADFIASLSTEAVDGVGNP